MYLLNEYIYFVIIVKGNHLSSLIYFFVLSPKMIDLKFKEIKEVSVAKLNLK